MAIDGEADLFLSYRALGLVIARHQIGRAKVDAEIFDQGNALNAFGVYSQLSRSDSKPVAVGAGGVIVANESVMFWKSRYFVRTSTTGSELLSPEKLVRFAGHVAAGLEGSSRLPTWTKALPPLPSGRSPQYVALNVLGYGFLSNAMLGEYGSGDNTCTLALVRGESEHATTTMWLRLTETYDQGKNDAALVGLGSDTFAGTAFGGEPVRAVRSGRYLVITVGSCPDTPGLITATVDRLAEAQKSL
ncbi:MAG: hypothetical protein JSV65_04820 [Armatimonadota bacterium]|nr:MAG: hypothetical protein JSV65_04820 [Armatimonadota bacterium]